MAHKSKNKKSIARTITKRFKENRSRYSVKLNPNAKYETKSALLSDDEDLKDRSEYSYEKTHLQYRHPRYREGWFAGSLGIICAVLSLFLLRWTVPLGIIAILLGFFARSWGNERLGRWAISLGIVCMLFGLLFLYFGRPIAG